MSAIPIIYELTIYIAGAGTVRREGGPSVAGHMWYRIGTSTGQDASYGFAPVDDKETLRPVLGRPTSDDTQNYIDPAFSRSFRISEAEYLALKAFGDKPFDNGFSSQYWAPSNSCIDFVWAALQKAGLNRGGYQGGLKPDGWFGNRDDIDRFMRQPVEQQRQNKQVIDDFLKFKLPLTGDLGSIDDPLRDFPDRFGDAERTTSPLILDLNGDGVKTLNKTAGKHFDHAGDGFAERTGWVDKDDGLLVRDLNGDGKITSGRELFGNHTALKTGKLAANGFEALKDLDSNADGLVDDKDAAFASLRVWKDTNGNGLTDTGELLTLAQAGVKSLKVGYTDVGSSASADPQGNQHQQLGTFTTTDGATRSMTALAQVTNAIQAANAHHFAHQAANLNHWSQAA